MSEARAGYSHRFVDERTILCFGDSNTWGCPPDGDERFPRHVRWPGALQGLLGQGYHVIEEGLGTNDLADHYHLSAADVAEACASLVRVVDAAECGRERDTPPVLFVCPPPIRATGPDAGEYETMAVKSRTLSARFADAAEAVGAELLDLDGVVRYAEEDPIHLDADGHRALAEAVEPLVRRLAPWPAVAVSI